MPLPPLPLLTKEGNRCLYLPTFPSSEKVPVFTKEGKEKAKIVNE